MCAVYNDSEFGQTDDQATWFSNFVTLATDRSHTVAAPGACLKSLAPLSITPACTSLKTCYRSALYGTSFAAPLVAGTVALCIHSRPCAGLTPAQIIQKIVADAAAYNQANPGYGFQGDPLHPITGELLRLPDPGRALLSRARGAESPRRLGTSHPLEVDDDPPIR